MNIAVLFATTSLLSASLPVQTPRLEQADLADQFSMLHQLVEGCMDSAESHRNKSNMLLHTFKASTDSSAPEPPQFQNLRIVLECVKDGWGGQYDLQPQFELLMGGKLFYNIEFLGP